MVDARYEDGHFAVGAIVNIVLLSTDVLPTPPPAYGGTERVVWELARTLGERGHHVTLVAHPDSHTPPGGECLSWDTVDLATVLKGADVIHDHGWRLIGWQWAREHPLARVVMTWHGPSLGPSVQWQEPPESLTVVGVSKFHAAILSGELGGVIVPAVYNAVDADAYPFYAGPRDHPPLVLARLDPDKGIHHLLAMAQWYPDRTLDVAGTEHMVPDRAYVQAILDRMDGRTVRYLGNLTQEEKVLALSRTRCLLWFTPGYEEPFGLGIVEAQLCGTPVVALNRGAIPEVVYPGGTLVERPQDMAGWMRPGKILPSPASVRAWAMHFDRWAMTDAYERIYAEDPTIPF